MLENYTRPKSKILKINGKFYDGGTTNKSFLKVAADLKKLGVKNYYFMLRIIDTSLIGIDPFDEEHLTKDQISRIIMECTRNKWYFLREISRIPANGGLPMMYKAHRGNIAQAWCIEKRLQSYLCIPRQEGKTQSAIADIVWGYLFGTTNSQILFINKDSDASKENLSRMVKQIELLPRYLQFKEVNTDEGKVLKGTNNVTKIMNPVNGNYVTIKGQATNLSKAVNIGRGLSAPIIYFDEVEFTQYIKVIVENSAPVFTKAASIAKANNAMYARLFTSTPGNLDDTAGSQASLIIKDTARWTEELYSMSDDQINGYIENNSENGILYIEYSYQQLGESEEWFDDMAKNIGNPMTVKREILLMRLRGSSDSPFEQEALEYILNKIQPIKEEIMLRKYYKLDVYTKFHRNIPYIVGVDCSTGSKKDNNAFTIIDPYTVKPVAEFKCNYVGETELVKILEELVSEYIPRAIVCIERNSVGDAIIDFILHESPELSKNLYFDKAKDLLEMNINDMSTIESILKKKASEKSHYGVYTSTATRNDMMSILQNRMLEFKDDFVCRNLTEDIYSLVVTSSGKIEARSGAHDDNIMSYLIAMYVFYHGNNLPLFGFIKGRDVVESPNQGMKVFDENRASNLLPKEVVASMKKEAEEYKDNWDDIYKQALIQSQKESRMLNDNNMVDDNIFSRTPEVVLEYDTDLDDSIDFSFFDSLNNF